jgi:hypothetical protein
VTKVAPNLTWATPAAIDYGTPLSSTQLSAYSGGVAGTFVYTPPAGTVLAAGTQTLSVTFLPADSTDLSSATATVSLTVNRATPTLLVSSSAPSLSYGGSVAFTASITGGPNGSVTFYDGGNSIGTGILQGTKATFTTNSLTVGTHTITAYWPGSTNYTSVASSPFTQVVNIAAPIITWPRPAPISYGTALTATQLDASSTTVGSFTYSPALGTFLSAGSRALSVTFTPTDTTDFSVATAAVLLQVNQVNPNISWSAPAAIAYGTPLSATQLNASSDGVAGTFYYTPPTGTILPAGTQTISATFLSSDTTNYGSPTVTVPITVNKSTPTIAVSSSASPSNYGAAVVLTATLSSGPTGSVTFYDGSKSIGTGNLQGTIATFTTTTLAVGSHSITASWSGNSNFNPVTATAIMQTVNQTQTATSLAAVPNPAIAGLPTVLNATIQLTAGLASPTGAVTFTDTFNGITIQLGSQKLGTAAAATISPMLAPGIHLIVATYAGDADTSGSASAPFALSANLATTAATVISAPNPAVVLAPITFTATVTGNGGPPTGTVSIYANGTTLLGAASLAANGSATIPYASPAVGTFPITAVYAGDVNNASTTSPAITQVIGSIPTAAAIGYSSTGGASPALILAATVIGVNGPTPTGVVKFTSGSTSLGSAPLDATGVATLNPNLASGVAYSILAAYAGDTLHSSSTSSPLNLTGTPTDYAVTVTPPTLTIAQSQNATVNVTVTSNSGYSDTIGLGCASLPAGVTCHFSTLNLALTANGSQSVQLTIDTSNPLGGGASAMLAHPDNRGVSLAGLLLPFCVFFSFFFRRFRRRNAPALNTALLVLLGIALLTGCSGITQISAAPGTYLIQVFGAGVNSNVTHFQNVTLTITQ